MLASLGGDLGAKVERLLHEGRRPVVDFSWPTWSERARVLLEDLAVRSRRAAPEPERKRATPKTVSS